MNESDSGAEENISKSDENMQEKIPPSEDNSQSSSPPKRLSMKDFISMKCLGTGTFGEVVLAKAIADKRKYAIKILSKAHMEKVGWHYGKTNTQKNAISEREFLSMFKCRQVPTLYSCFQDGSSLYYVLEYCSGGTLKEYLDQCSTSYPKPRKADNH